MGNIRLPFCYCGTVILECDCRKRLLYWKMDDTGNKWRFTNGIIDWCDSYFCIQSKAHTHNFRSVALAFFVELPFSANLRRIPEFWYLHRSLWVPYQLVINPSCTRSCLIVSAFLFWKYVHVCSSTGSSATCTWYRTSVVQHVVVRHD